MLQRTKVRIGHIIVSSMTILENCFDDAQNTMIMIVERGQKWSWWLSWSSWWTWWSCWSWWSWSSWRSFEGNESRAVGRSNTRTSMLDLKNMSIEMINIAMLLKMMIAILVQDQNSLGMKVMITGLYEMENSPRKCPIISGFTSTCANYCQENRN